LAQALSGPALRPYVSTDVIGVAVGGAVKNVLAIACGEELAGMPERTDKTTKDGADIVGVGAVFPKRRDDYLRVVLRHSLLPA
jgi:glycerol-3-phosphate dehydrogenase (NAD(P)+)